MQNLPTPILGEITAFTITTHDLEKSLACYKKLGYKELYRAEWPFPWIQITDGVVLIMLRKDAKPYLALTYYVKDIDKVTADLVQKGIKFEMKPKKTDPVKRWLLRSPDGMAISLVNIIEGFEQPAGPGMLQMNPEDYFNPEKYVNKTCGLFGELAHPVADLEKSIEFWQLLGFKTLSRFTSPYPWAILSDGLAIVGLHQTKEFEYPAITYFATDMPVKIAALKKAGLTGFTPKGPSDVILTTPEQQHIFLFSLGGGAAETKKPEVNARIIETERMRLKELTPEIYNELFTTYADEDLISFLGLSGPDELATEKSNWQQGMTTYRISFRLFLLTEKDTGKVIGRCGIHNWYAIHKRAEIGYTMTDSSMKQKGYMKEAVAAIVRYGFEQLGLNRLEAFTGPANIASQKVLKGAGFVHEATLVARYCHEGVIGDDLCYRLLKTAYYAI